jgi:hypothetical protein|nr:MAG TPA: hypothetical protein [Caudoviricetes sp.]
MKVIAKFKDDRTYAHGFECGKEYQAYELFQCQPDCNFLSSYGMVVIDDDGDAIPAYDADRLWGVTFEVVS